MCLLQFTAGDTFSRSFAVTQPGGAAVDLTGAVAVFGMVSTPVPTNVLQAASTDGTGNVTIPTPTNGVVVVTLLPASTEVLPAGSYTRGLKIIYPTGYEKTYALAPVIVNAPIVNKF